MKKATSIVSLIQGILSFVGAGICLICLFILVFNQAEALQALQNQGATDSEIAAMASTIAVSIASCIYGIIACAVSGVLCFVIRVQANKPVPPRGTLIALGILTIIFSGVPAGVLAIVLGASQDK